MAKPVCMISQAHNKWEAAREELSCMYLHLLLWGVS